MNHIHIFILNKQFHIIILRNKKTPTEVDVRAFIKW